MSFIARKSLMDKPEDFIDATEVTDTLRNYYCPYCDCIFRFRSEASNKRAAHFFKKGEHSSNCQLSDANLIKGKIDRDIAKDTDFFDFYQNIISAKERIMSEKKPVQHHKSNTSSTLHLNTIRNMYKFCTFASDNDYIGTIRVKDVFVARKTSYLYVSYINGIKLIEASLHSFNPETQTLFLYYPCNAKSYHDATFRICVTVEDNKLFKKKKILFDSISNKLKVLILADWKTRSSDNMVFGTVTNMHQIVILKPSLSK